MNNNIYQQNRVFILAILIGLLAFVLPFGRIVLAGQKENLYLLTAFGGWISFGVAVIMALVQLLFLWKQQRFLGWWGMLLGLYFLWLGIYYYREMYLLNQASGSKGLGAALQFSASAMPAVFIFALSGGIIFAIALAKFIRQQR